ncbi:MAG: XdhC family protein [Candidatus Eremiobacteraeota bacterium]|nr:XdhC family protein [Candidatus Eremiobacteraeota bacterium]
MRDVFASAARWLQNDKPFALATLIAARNSSPSPLGTTVAVSDDGEVAGNIGAGCYESDVIEACLQTLRDGQLRKLSIDLSSTDEITGTAGCGGTIDIVAWLPGTTFAENERAIARGDADVRVVISDDTQFTVPAKPRLIVVGATSLAQAIASFARLLDFYVIVVDPRPVFATRERIPDADELIVEWPDAYLERALNERAAVVVVSHDPKFDLPALRTALASDAWYIGLLGSRRSQAARREALRAMNVKDEALARIHGPVGLDLGGETAPETAVSILAQIVAARNGGSGTALDSTARPIHGGATITA